MKRLITALSAIVISVLWVAPAIAAPYLKVEISDPAPVLNSRSFNIEFTTLTTDATSTITVNLFQETGASDTLVGTRSINNGKFGDSGVFAITVASDGTYEYYITASGSKGGSSSDGPVSTHVDTSAPAAPTYEGARRVGNTYTLPYTAPNTSDVTQLRFYSSTSTSFVADSSTQIGTVNVSPGQSGTFQYTATSSAQRYHAVQAFDAAGNFSSLVTDPNVTVSQGEVAESETSGTTTFGTASTSQGGDTATNGTDGVVLGDQDDEEEGVVSDEAVTIEEDGDVQGARSDENDASTADDDNASLIAGLIAIPVLLAALYYIFFHKSGRFFGRK